MGKKLDAQLRDTHYTSAVQELCKAGALHDACAKGFTPDGVCWKKLNRTYLAGVQTGVVKDSPNGMICLPLNQLGSAFVQHPKNYLAANILWSHEFIAIEQDDKADRGSCKTANGGATFESD